MARGAFQGWRGIHLRRDEEAEGLVNQSLGADTLQVRGQGYGGRGDGRAGFREGERGTCTATRPSTSLSM